MAMGLSLIAFVVAGFCRQAVIGNGGYARAPPSWALTCLAPYAGDGNNLRVRGIRLLAVRELFLIET